jgi:CBS domain containing-hemolysin-like protein
MALLIFYILLALGVSFLCSIMEAVLLSVTPSYLALQEQRGGAAAKRLRALKNDIDRPLAAILSLNTIAHTIGAMGAGAQAAIVFGQAYLGIISGILTLLILVLSEIIPKTLGALYWKALVPAVVRLLWPLMWLMWPLVKLSQGITGFLSRGGKKNSVSRAEMAAMAELGTREGVIEEGESRILKHLFRFSSLRAEDIMTPRTVMFTLQQDVTVGDAIADGEQLRFSRIPVFRSNLDDITGFVLKDDILLRAAQDQLELPLREIRRELMVVPETLPLPDLFERMLAAAAHIALVVDEYGGTAGLVTIEDLVETVLGLEIVDEADQTKDMQALARQQWRRRARLLDLVHEEVPQNEHRAAIRLGLTGQHPTDTDG